MRFFDNHEEQAFERTGRRSTNGPNIMVSRTTRQSFTVCLDALTKLSNVLTEIGKESLLSMIVFNSLTILSVEGFFSGMRADRDMPTVVEYPHNMSTIRDQDPPNITSRPKKKHDGIVIPRVEENVLKDFARQYGKGMRELNVT